MRVTFTFKNGRTVVTNEVQAKLLKKIGKGDYITRDMADQPFFEKQVEVETQEPEDGLDAMDKDELHALAKERGMKVHHNAGADKVREALRQ